MSSIRLDDPVFAEIQRSGIPYMFFNRRPRQDGNFVVLDNRKAGEMLAGHLLEYGHERIAYMSGKPDISTFHERLIGYEHALKEAGVALHRDWIYHFDRPNDNAIRAIIRTLMDEPLPPTAIFCASDELALYVLDTLLELGCEVPGDVSVAGIDDITISSHSAIRLTSVGQHKYKMGKIATHHLIRMIEHPDESTEPVQVRFQPQLYVRDTTAPVRA